MPELEEKSEVTSIKFVFATKSKLFALNSGFSRRQIDFDSRRSSVGKFISSPKQHATAHFAHYTSHITIHTLHFTRRNQIQLKISFSYSIQAIFIFILFPSPFKAARKGQKGRKGPLEGALQQPQFSQPLLSPPFFLDCSNSTLTSDSLQFTFLFTSILY